MCAQVKNKEYRKFPIIGTYPPESIPWDFIAPYESQAERNHGGQTLEVLARRHGLSWQEVFAVVNNKIWTRDDIPSMSDTKKAVLERIAKWEAEQECIHSQE